MLLLLVVVVVHHNWVVDSWHSLIGVLFVRFGCLIWFRLFTFLFEVETITGLIEVKKSGVSQTVSNVILRKFDDDSALEGNEQIKLDERTTSKGHRLS